MTPSVSVVICTYNHARFLHKSLQSVFAQGWPDDALEVIVVDDGSTDATPKLMRRWVRDRGVSYIRKENGGHLSSFNRGIAAATGEYIVLHDGDDMLRPRMLAPRIELMERDPEIGLVHGDLRVVDVHGNVLVPSLFEAYAFEQLDGDLLPQLVWRNVVSSGGTVFRASLREQCHPIPDWAGHAQDWWIAAAIAQVARIGCVREAVTDYRKHDANLNLGSSGEKLAKLVRSELPFRRHLLSGGHTARVPARALLRGLDLLDDIVRRLMATGDQRAELTPVDDRQRAASGERRALGLAALAAGDDEAAARQFAGALALDPWDVASRRELTALRRRRGWLENAPARGRALGPSPAERPHGARGFAVAADGAELAHDPRLLAAYARHFSAHDDATLAISVAEDGLDALAAAVSRAGLDTPAAPDLLAITSGAPAAADAVLAAQPPQGGAPVWADGDGIAGLRAWQARRAGRPGPLSFALALDAPDPAQAAQFGETRLARELQRHLHRLGHPCAVLTQRDWAGAHDAALDVVVHLRRGAAFPAHPGQANILWALGDEPPADECDRADLVLVESGALAAALAGRTTTAVTSLGDDLVAELLEHARGLQGAAPPAAVAA